MRLNRAHLRRDERTFEVTIERRAEGDDEEKALHIVGHPIVYGRWSDDLGGFRERVLPGAVTKTLRERDVPALLNHDVSLILGGTAAENQGRMTLTDGPSSLRMDLRPLDTPTIRDLVIAPMEANLLDKMSFAFRTISDEWREPKKEGQLWERDLREVQLWDVSIVLNPAYTQTDAALRSALANAGISWDVLAATLTRADRGVTLTDSDTDLLNGSIAVLRSYLPEHDPQEPEHDPQEPEPSATTPDEPRAGRSIAHLMRLLDLHERELALT